MILSTTPACEDDLSRKVGLLTLHTLELCHAWLNTHCAQHFRHAYPQGTLQRSPVGIAEA
jgi:hypothetical protein